VPVFSCGRSLSLYTLAYGEVVGGNDLQHETSRSAVTKKTRNASCLSVVSFNSTKRRVESFIVSYVRYRFVTVCS